MQVYIHKNLPTGLLHFPLFIFHFAYNLPLLYVYMLAILAAIQYEGKYSLEAIPENIKRLLPPCR